MHRLLCVLVVVVAAFPAAAAAGPLYGVYAEDGLRGDAATAAQQHAAGLSVVRIPFSWRDAEPARGVHDWRRTDAAVAIAAQHDLTVLPFLLDAPPWAQGPPAAVSAPGATPPQDPARFADFATAAVARYGPAGTFWATYPQLPPRPIRAWQIWNEPNLWQFWPPKPDAVAYAALLRAAGAAVHAADPGAEVVAAGLPDSWLGVGLQRYLEDLYAAGAKGTFDALAVHAYAPTASGVVGVVDRARAVAAHHGDAALPMWVTEYGYASAGLPDELTSDEPGQARRVSKATLALRRSAAASHLEGIVYFNWRDPVRPAGTWNIWPYHAGLLRVDGSPKPALAALTSALAVDVRPLELRMRARHAGRRGPVVTLRCSRRCRARVVLRTRAGHVLGRWTGALRAGHARRARLRVHARRPGRLTLTGTARAPDGTRAAARVRLT